jgi:pimeloyl-ACP methyl ester carboxylesterase
VFGALLALFGFLSSIKATTERLTQSWLDRKKARRLRKQMAAASARSGDRRRAAASRGPFRPPSLPKHGMPMPSFHNGAVEIAYLDEGEGDPIVLVHGFASSKNVNWVYPTWVSELKKNGRRVIALDNRGHGDSASSTTRAISHPDHGRRCHRADGSSGIERADIMGYSLGSRMTAWLALQPAAAAAFGDSRRHRHRPDRGRRPRRKRRRGAGGAVARRRHRSGRAHLSRLRRPDPLRPPRARRLPARLAAADDAGGGRGIAVPVLIAVGTKDEIAGSAEALGKIIPGPHARRREVLDIPNRDHMRAVGDKVYKTGVLDFLSFQASPHSPESMAGQCIRSIRRRTWQKSGRARSDLGSRAHRGGRHRPPRAGAGLLHLFDRAAS